ncbi:EpsG family protein [Pseudoalteromonas nigrifaciens]|uniref:EpsG family protein n=1 Tax=Pseudoalteromonas nigrifaciens TaxID=28109 RepID=UPI003CFBCDA5
MSFYITMFLTIVILGLSKFKYKNLSMIFILFLVSALRFDVGFDFLSYYTSIVEFKPGDMTYIRFGLLHGALIEFSNRINFTQLYFIITSAVMYFFIHLALKNHSKNYFYSVLIFITIPFFFLMSVNFIKQFTAMAVVLYSTKYILNRNFIKFSFAIIFAAMLHSTALACIFLYFLYPRRVSSWVLISLFVGSFFSFSLAQKAVDAVLPFYSHYLLVKVDGGKVFQVLLVILFSLFIIIRRLLPSAEANFYFYVFTLGACIYNTFQPIGFSATRVSYYLLVYLIFLVPLLSVRIRKNQFLLVILTITFPLFVISLYMNSKVGTRSPSIPYQVFFNKDIHDIRPYGWVKKDE